IVAVGYQRAVVRLGPADQPLVAGLKICVALIPTSPPLCPPTAMIRPSGSWRWAEQKICVVRLGAAVNAWVVGFQTRTDGVPPVSHASHTTTLPLSSSEECTATSGQLMSGPHWPAVDGSETDAARFAGGAEARSVDDPITTSASAANAATTSVS